ncbi:MAG: RNA polymerase sigma factor, partial [Armatimonadota bacterium]|nr:RNA polymerase sigma factor [Armatimonadota bacterium]
MRTDDGKKEDGELVQRTRGGDRAAFTALVSRYRDMVYGTAYHYLGNAEDAQDAAQEAFVTAYGRLGQLREPDKFAPWLRRLTLNVCADTRRKRGAGPMCWEACPASMPDEAERVTTRLAMQDALGRLPERMRLTLTLCCLDGYSHAEVARFLDIPRNTVRSRLQHAKRQLREEMRDMVSEELNGSKPDEQWTRQIVDEALRRGEAALRAYEKGEAAGHYDAALTAIEALPPGLDRKRLMMDALWQKGKTEGDIALREQSLALAEELGDLPGQIAKLMDLGSAFYNKGDDANATDRYQYALALARQTGDARSQACCLTSLGLGRLWGDLGQGAALFAQALPLYEETGDINGATYCRAMLAVASELGPENLFVEFSTEKGFRQPIIGFYAGCDTFQAEAGKVT